MFAAPEDVGAFSHGIGLRAAGGFFKGGIHVSDLPVKADHYDAVRHLRRKAGESVFFTRDRFVVVAQQKKDRDRYSGAIERSPPEMRQRRMVQDKHDKKFGRKY